MKRLGFRAVSLSTVGISQSDNKCLQNPENQLFKVLHYEQVLIDFYS